jgi:hypothetical protein
VHNRLHSQHTFSSSSLLASRGRAPHKRSAAHLATLLRVREMGLHGSASGIVRTKERVFSDSATQTPPGTSAIHYKWRDAPLLGAAESCRAASKHSRSTREPEHETRSSQTAEVPHAASGASGTASLYTEGPPSTEVEAEEGCIVPHETGASFALHLVQGRQSDEMRAPQPQTAPRMGLQPFSTLSTSSPGKNAGWSATGSTRKHVPPSSSTAPQDGGACQTAKSKSGSGPQQHMFTRVWWYDVTKQVPQGPVRPRK